jgi:hypothetical protein
MSCHDDDVCVGQLIISLDELHASRMQCMISLTRFGLHVQALAALEGVFKGRWSDRGDAHIAGTAGTYNRCVNSIQVQLP